MLSKTITLGVALASLATLTTWTAVLEGKGGSAVRGTATVESVGTDSARATVQVTGAKAGVEYSWHVHSGACGIKGPIFGDAAQYPSIKPDRDGNASGTVVLAAAVPASGDYSVTVHKSKKDLTPVACGTLKRSMKDGMAAGVSMDSMHTMPMDSMKTMPMHMPMDSTMRKDSLPKP